MTNMMMNDNHTIDILSQLDAMRVQEATMRCHNYFNGTNSNNCIDESCRTSMVQWIQLVQSTLGLNSETVWIAMNFFDRYLSSGKGNSSKVLQSKCKFQLAAITAFYTAVKIYEPVVLGVDMLLQICRGTYTEADILAMEKDILTALNWRVSCYTPMDYARSLLELLPEVPSCVSESLLQACQTHLNYAVSNIYFTCCTSTSALGISCLSAALTESNILKLSEKQAIWCQLSDICDFSLTTKEVVAAHQCLIALSTPYPVEEQITSPLNKTSLLKQSNVTVFANSTSSPVCVSQTARQA